MRILYSLLFFLSYTLFNAQLLHPAANLSYRIVPKHSIFQVGIEFKPHQKMYNDSPYIFGASLLYTRLNHKDKFIPEINFIYGSPQSLIGGFFTGASITPYAIEPRLGLNFYNLILINTGYALPIDKNKYFKGITLGIQINLSGDSFYRGPHTYKPSFPVEEVNNISKI